MGQPKDERRYTYADYCSWDDGQRWELIDGVAYMLAAPGERHQRIAFVISGQLYNFLRGKKGQCRAYVSPFDVRLGAGGGEDETVVQPDLLVICDQGKIDDKGCKGAPDLVIEILSPSTSHHDTWVKFHLYRRAGVREYWIVDPDTKTVQVCTLHGRDYMTTTYEGARSVPAAVLPGCEIDLTEVFSENEEGANS